MCVCTCFGNECPESCWHRAKQGQRLMRGQKRKRPGRICTAPCWSCVQLSPSRWAWAPAAEHRGCPRAAPSGAPRNWRLRQTPGPVCDVPAHWLNLQHFHRYGSKNSQRGGKQEGVSEMSMMQASMIVMQYEPALIFLTYTSKKKITASLGGICLCTQTECAHSDYLINQGHRQCDQ